MIFGGFVYCFPFFRGVLFASSSDKPVPQNAPKPWKKHVFGQFPCISLFCFGWCCCAGPTKLKHHPKTKQNNKTRKEELGCCNFPKQNQTNTTKNTNQTTPPAKRKAKTKNKKKKQTKPRRHKTQEKMRNETSFSHPQHQTAPNPEVDHKQRVIQINCL